MRKQALVIWHDAHSTRDELNMDEIKTRHKPSLVRTYGDILISDAVGVTIAGERLPDESANDTFRNSTFIPRGMVVSEGVVKRAKKTSTGTFNSPVRTDTQETGGTLRNVPPEANG